MKIDELLAGAHDALRAARVYGEPVERDGVTVIPAAAVRGGLGGGGGTEQESGNEGAGGGFGVLARPVGAFVIAHGRVRWRPAIDMNRAITIAGLAAALWMFLQRHDTG